MTQKGTYRAWLNKVYGQQRSSSKTRNHPKPDYTKQELGDWLDSNYRQVFIDLFASWVASGYEKSLVPSIDRIDDDLPYTLNNIRLVTWEENENAYRSNREKNKRNKAVIGVCLRTEEEFEYLSSALAAEKLGVNQMSISRAARGERKSYAGYHWEFKGTPWVFNRK